jgi:hypothetical protein
MSGRSANDSIASAKATIRSLYQGVAGVGGSEEETSKIGGMGRMGADAEGKLSEAPHHRVDEMMGGGGNATKGEMGVGYGVGRTLGKE